MINKLRKKISFIVLSAIAIPFLIGVIFYNFSYYSNVVKSNGGFVDRFFDEPLDHQKNENKEDVEAPDKFEMPTINGVYSVTISEGEIISNVDNISDDIKEYAIKVSKKSGENGIIGNYIYKRITKNSKDNSINIVLVESTNEINKIYLVFGISIIVLVIGLILIYMLSKKIAILIVRPVEETFTKQIDFISDASHELKTPLAVIQANADVLEGEIGNNKWLSYIQNEIDNMGKLISELLLLTKIENIDKLREPENINMSDHVELVVSTFESMAFEKNIKIESIIQKDIITEKFNRDDITHILSTLIDNAIKHSYEKKKVVIELKKEKDKLKILVKNQGQEIPLSEREKIFDRFYRIDKSRNRNEKRYGLGLAIAKATVQKNNGVIYVDCKGGHTIFTVELPL